MQTTAILAELLVIGSVALLWFLAILKSVTDFDFSNSLNTTAGIIISLATLYLLGILVNFLSDRMFCFYSKEQTKKRGGKKSFQIARTKILLKSPEAAAYMAMRRSILRIMRASTFNFIIYAIIVFFGITDLINNVNNFWEGILFLFIATFFFWGYRHTLIGYLAFLKMTENMIDAKSN